MCNSGCHRGFSRNISELAYCRIFAYSGVYEACARACALEMSVHREEYESFVFLSLVAIAASRHGRYVLDSARHLILPRISNHGHPCPLHLLSQCLIQAVPFFSDVEHALFGAWLSSARAKKIKRRSRSTSPRLVRRVDLKPPTRYLRAQTERVVHDQPWNG